MDAPFYLFLKINYDWLSCHYIPSIPSEMFRRRWTPWTTGSCFGSPQQPKWTCDESGLHVKFRYSFRNTKKSITSGANGTEPAGHQGNYIEWSNLPLDRARQGWSIYVQFWKGMGRWATNGKVGPKYGICPLKRGPPQNKKKHVILLVVLMTAFFFSF